MPGSALRIAAIMAISLGLLPSVQAQSDPQTDDWSRQDRQYMERMKREDEPEKQKNKSPEEIREALLEKAKELIRDKNYASKKTAHYMIRTDDPRLDLAAAGDLLERFRVFFVQFWEDEFDLEPFEDQSQVFLFYSFYKYNKIWTGKERFGEFRPAGHYRPDTDLITLHSDSSVLDALPGSLVHEAAHQLAEKMLFGGGPPRAGWLEEGLASYFGFTGLKAMGEGSRSVAKDRKSSSPKLARGRLAELKRTLGDKKSWFSVIDLMDIQESQEFYGADIRINYAASWVLVHYLLHGEEGAYREPFVRMMKEDQAMAGGSEKVLAALGVDEATFKAGYEHHAKKMKP